MRPDKKKRQRGRNYGKSEESGTQERKNNVIQESKNDGDDSKSEATQNKSEEIEKTDQNTSVTKESSVTKVPGENQPAPTLRRETDALKENKKFSKRQIFSNWEKYDEPIVIEEEEEELQNDFGMLIQRNISGDDHFKFKCEREWESESCNINQDLFTLNLEQLSAGLECIPYYKRLDLPDKLFSKNELQRMHNRAQAEKKKYEKLLQGEADNKPETIIASLLGKLKENEEDQVILENDVSSETESQEVPLMDISQFVIHDSKVDSEEGMLSVSHMSESLTHENCFSEEMEGGKKSSDSILRESQLKGSKKNKNCVDENEINVSETESVELNSVWESQVDRIKSEVKKSAPEKKKSDESSAPKKGNRPNKSQDIPANVETFVEDTTKKISVESIVKDISKELVVKKDKPLSGSDSNVAPKTKDIKSKNASKINTMGEEEEVLDTLLSLKAPALSQFELSKKKAEEEENEADGLLTDVSSIVIHEKKENLEEWLDSMLDD